MGNGEVNSFLDGLPEKHVANPPLRSITYIDVVMPETQRNRKYPSQNTLGYCSIQDTETIADVILYRQQDLGNKDTYTFKFSLLHEIGHVVFEFVLSHSAKKQWYGIQANNFVRWNPACREPLEQFCDTYACYWLDGGYLEKVFPTEYQFIAKHVFY